MNQNMYEVVQSLEKLSLSPAESTVVKNASARQNGYVGTQFLSARQVEELKIIYQKYFPEGVTK
jgi:hypothetical protein